MKSGIPPLMVGIGVVAAMALLFGGLTVWDTYKLKHRDNARLDHMQEYSEGFEQLRTRIGHYPRFPNGVELTGTDPLSKQLKAELVFRRIPRDPLYPEFSYTYQSTNNANSYAIRFCLETDQFEGYTKGCDNVYTPR